MYNIIKDESSWQFFFFLDKVFWFPNNNNNKQQPLKPHYHIQQKRENVFHLQCTSSFYSNAHTSWPCEWTWCSLMAMNMISNDAIENVLIHKKKFTFADPNHDIIVNFPLLQPPIGEKRVEELGKWVRKEFRVCDNSWGLKFSGCCCFRSGLVCCRT